VVSNVLDSGLPSIVEVGCYTQGINRKLAEDEVVGLLSMHALDFGSGFNFGAEQTITSMETI